MVLCCLTVILSVSLLGYFSYWDIWQFFIKNETSYFRTLAKPVVSQWMKSENLTHAVAVNKKEKVLTNGKQLTEEPSSPSVNQNYIRQAFSGENEITFCSRTNGKPVVVLLIPLRLQPQSKKVFGVIQINTSLSGIHKILFRSQKRFVANTAYELLTAGKVWMIRGPVGDIQLKVGLLYQGVLLL